LLYVGANPLAMWLAVMGFVVYVGSGVDPVNDFPGESSWPDSNQQNPFDVPELVLALP